ncbi:MAG: chemotaxis protein CheA [Deltaproteobacteria bacterium HGW-Deltaproteobacteria-6]|jgi:two-component system chemotaxis sensor kinase CheA|nr:MAG: chemotaxis protein CheA [Deltaproteobacteria bacterium HGW-Deltaproteobacteria-6]
MMDPQTDVFKEEAFELLTELEGSLLALEKTPDDADLIAGIFRSMHTIKGSGAMFGFDEVASFTHNIETVYDLLRNKKIVADKALIDLTLEACDRIRQMIEGKEEIRREKIEEHAAAFKRFIPAMKEDAPCKEKPFKAESGAQKGRLTAYRICFAPDVNIFSRGTKPSLLLSELRDLGKCTVMARTDRIPGLDEIDPEGCYTSWDIVLTTSRGINAIRDVFIFVEDESLLKIEVIDEEPDDEPRDYKKLGEILVERGYADRDVIDTVLSSHKKIGELLVESGIVAPDKIQAALAEQQLIREAKEKRQSADTAATIRVPARRLDNLVNLVGEMVTVQSRLSQMSSSLNHTDLMLVAEEVERLVAELRDNTMSIRMLPIGNTFSKFKRLVHDLSAELGKEISLVTEGGETELDKTVIEKLNDPLVHLIRNSIDHGIELPAEREARSKPRTGTVRLAAEHSGANVLIHIEDDGAGINPDRVRAKALENNLISPDANLTEKEIFSLIFAPGFSLAKTITSVSGRGVGMDVVKKSIDALNGTIDISSRPPDGTKITLKLPLTLAIIDGLLVKIASSFFIIPLSAIEECVELTDADISRANGKNMVHIRGEMVPYIPLRERFGMDGKRQPIEQIIINRVGDERIGLVVDQVIGEHQTVIKSLGKFYKQTRELSGATILGDGTVALIIDIPQLMQRAVAEAR